MTGRLSIDSQVERSRAPALLAGLGGSAKSGVTKDEGRTFADQCALARAAAVKTGWSLPNELREPDLDALRGREDFQHLALEVEAKAETIPKKGQTPSSHWGLTPFWD